MIAFDPNSLCREAKIYYYDFLYNESRKAIPQRFVKHMEHCTNCQRSINGLVAALSEAEERSEPQQEEHSSAVTTMLRLHFAYTGEHVTCDTVKPFLPGLLHPALEIRIPTPITAHLDNCPECTEDIERIRELGLNREQLCRLSQLFAQEVTGDSTSCSQAQAGILAVVSMALHETTKEVLKHLCTCRDCREALYQYREIVREQYLHEASGQAEFPCNEVSAADVFDYVVPYSLDPARDEYARFRQSFTSHVRCCPTCLAKMQQLHSTIYTIAERAESDVVTIYHLSESAGTEAASEPGDRYAGFPIRVEITSRRQPVRAQPVASISSIVAALKEKVSTMNFRLLARAGVAAAAVVLVVGALLLYTQPARAMTIEPVYKALEKVKNVHVSKLVPGKREPIQEMWVSQTLAIYLTKTGNRFDLIDTYHRVGKSRMTDSDETETFPLTPASIATFEKKITRISHELMPFDDPSNIPAGTIWSRVAGDSSRTNGYNLELYDLMWIEEDRGTRPVFKRWRVSVDPKTYLPHEVRLYRRLVDDSEYSLESVIVVEYPPTSKIQTVMKDAGF